MFKSKLLYIKCIDLMFLRFIVSFLHFHNSNPVFNSLWCFAIFNTLFTHSIPSSICAIASRGMIVSVRWRLLGMLVAYGSSVALAYLWSSSGVSNSSLMRFGGGLEGGDVDPSAGSGSGNSVVGPFPPTKC